MPQAYQLHCSTENIIYHSQLPRLQRHYTLLFHDRLPLRASASHYATSLRSSRLGRVQSIWSNGGQECFIYHITSLYITYFFYWQPTSSNKHLLLSALTLASECPFCAVEFQLQLQKKSCLGWDVPQYDSTTWLGDAVEIEEKMHNSVSSNMLGGKLAEMQSNM